MTESALEPAGSEIYEAAITATHQTLATALSAAISAKRQADALERIAASIEQVAMLQIILRPETVQDYTVEDHLLFEPTRDAIEAAFQAGLK